jgi:hypothetical protein
LADPTKSFPTFTAYLLPIRGGLSIAFTARLEGATMNVNALEGIVYLLIMIGIVAGPWFMMKMITNNNRRRRNRHVQQGVANYLRQASRN